MAETEDSEQPKRPNANYKLSKPDNDPLAEEQLTFYYNREHRLAKAPQIVRDLYNKPKYSGFNLLRPLIADKPRATLFFTIVLLTVVIILLSILSYFNTSFMLDDNRLGISAVRYEDITIIVIKKSARNSDSAYIGTVDIAVSPTAQEEQDFPVFVHRIFFTMEKEEEYRFTVPFDSEQLVIVMQTENSAKNFKLKVD